MSSKTHAEFLNRQQASYRKNYLRKCRCCGEEIMMAKNQHFCSETCKGKWKYINRNVTTESQYLRISGNWKRYVSRLLYYGGRKRDQLTQDILLKKLKEQDFKCKLTGEPLTCDLKKGTISMTNASIDRIIAGGPYTEDNIQIVCRAVNYWRNNLTVKEFVDWCQKVVDHNKL